MLQWTYPQWAWLVIPAVPLLIWFHLRSLSDFPKRQRWVSLGIRSIVTLLLIAALCGPILLKQTVKQMIVFAVDSSESIDAAARQRANEFLQEAVENAREQETEIRFLTFNRQPSSIGEEWQAESYADEAVGINGATSNANDETKVEPTEADSADSNESLQNESGDDEPSAELLEQTESSNQTEPSGQTEPSDRQATNLEAAIRTAVAAIPPTRVPTVVMLTDGNSTEGADPLSAASESGVPVFTVPLPVRSEPEVQLTRVAAPSQVRQGEPFFVEVVVSSNHETDGIIDLYRGDIQIGEENDKRVTIKKGENRFRFRQSITGSRQEIFAARLRDVKDTLLDNNEASTVVYAQGRPRILLVDPDIDQTDSLRWALDEQQIDVDVRPPEGVPTSLSELQGYECLVLSNVPATAMTMRQMDLMKLYVQDLGGGLVMLGGDQSFGLGGYYRTQIEEILPVRSNFEKEREKPSLAMMLVIDKSGSMGGEKIELAKDAARAAVELLSPKDSIGVIAFDGAAYTVSELRTAADHGAIIDAIATIEASGGTNMYPAMVDAFDALRGSPARLKHVIMMTDGISSAGDFEGAASEMSASRMTLSTVALGQGASEALLEDLAKIGGGRYYFCDDPQTVPQVFAKETVEASQSAINELPFAPQVVRPTTVLDGIELDLAPLLLGYVVTRPKPTAEFILASESGDPLLVWWRYGLGMTVAFTSDAKSRWASEWLNWYDFGPFWAQVIRHAMRKEDNKGVYVDLIQNGNETSVILDAVDETGKFIDQAETKLTLIDPQLGREQLAMKQTAPGRFEATIRTPRRGSYHLDIAQQRANGESQRVSRGITVGYPDELRLLPLGESTMQQISQVSGGKYDASIEEILTPDGRTAREPQALWPWLLMIALGLFVADVALRRVELG